MSGRGAAWERVSAAVHAEVERGLDDLLAAIRIPSVVAWGGDHLRDSAAFLARLLDDDGWRADAFAVGGNHVVFAEIGPGPADGAAAALFYGHHDVQPPEPLEAWTTPPFEPVIREGRIYGRGSADDKGQFFCHVFAVRAIRRALGGVPVRLKFFLDGEEEAGNPNLAAGASRIVRPGIAAYSASKAGVEVLSRALALELAPHRIQVHAVNPGLTENDYNERVRRERPDEHRTKMAKIPLGRMGKPEEVAALVVFLLSPAASYMTGCVIDSDGGYTLGIPRYA